MRNSTKTLLGVLLIFALAFGSAAVLPYFAGRYYGPAASWLTIPQLIEYSARLLWADGLLTKPLDADAPEREFEVRPGETVASVCHRLEQQGFLKDGGALRDYLIYTGLDTSLQSGSFRLSAAMSPVAIARSMQDATPQDVDFVVLAGWRIEEIAAALPTSGLAIEPAVFIKAAHWGRASYDFLDGANTLEGFLFPDTYILPRTSGVSELLDMLLRGFDQHLRTDLRQEFATRGLSVRDAVILASIVQREAVREEESPLIASVYLNRLQAGMPLGADPTVQYALGYNFAQQTWWTNPLSLEDLKIESPYNTYQVIGLPPGPIANPGLMALEAVAEPASSSYLYFHARCDGSGWHVFSQTFDEHLASLCQ